MSTTHTLPVSLPLPIWERCGPNSSVVQLLILSEESRNRRVSNIRTQFLQIKPSNILNEQQFGVLESQQFTFWFANLLQWHCANLTAANPNESSTCRTAGAGEHQAPLFFLCKCYWCLCTDGIQKNSIQWRKMACHCCLEMRHRSS